MLGTQCHSMGLKQEAEIVAPFLCCYDGSIPRGQDEQAKSMVGCCSRVLGTGQMEV